MAVDTSTWEAKLIPVYSSSGNLLLISQRLTQVLPDGNALINWSSEGAITEFLHNGEPNSCVYLDSDLLGLNVQNYRAFEFNLPRINYTL